MFNADISVKYRLNFCLGIKSNLVSNFCFLLVVLWTSTHKLCAQTAAEADAATARVVEQLFDASLSDSRCYDWLEHLCLHVGHRLSGSAGAEKAVTWTKGVLDTLGLDSVWLQPVMVPRWERGAPELVRIHRRGAPLVLPALALGGSVATPGKGLEAEVVEIKRWGQLDSLGAAGRLQGKIVFYNRPMESTHLRTFEAYGGAVGQRVHGASRAAQYGAVAMLVRSMGLRIDDFPHTGTLRYDSTYALIPAAAISTRAAEQLHQVLQNEGKASVFISLHCRTLPDVPSYNVIGEIRGSEKPEEVMLVGGHLDSWDVGHGAHDDGAGCVQSMEVLRLFKKIGYRPRHTVRCVLFMNEENGLRGGQVYAREAQRKHEFHDLAIESDAGGFTPRGFSFDAAPGVLAFKSGSADPGRKLPSIIARS